MSINDLLEQGIEIQGKYNIEVWDKEKEDYEAFVMGENFELDNDDIEDKYLDGEILYMYSKGNTLVIEIEL